MRIKKLELSGFKSFKEKTLLEFSDGVTGIVGPNGCGKSNIVDALLWVMGETSIKSLRGSSMSDVIFAGTASTPSMSYAEVSLILENQGGVFPAKYSHLSEIMLTRRLYKSGESVYLINKKPVRLKDVQALFMDTGAGSRGFSIIEQGAIHHIVTAKSEERRALIEEVAGLTQFKMRKKESETKLKSTEQNVLRIQDILSEKKKQMKALEKQVKKAEKYKNLKQEIKKQDLYLLSFQFSNFKESFQGQKKEEEEWEKKSEESLTLQNQLGAKKESLSLSLAEKQDELNKAQMDHKEQSEKLKTKELQVQSLHFETQKRLEKQKSISSLMEQQKQIEEGILRDLKKQEMDLEKTSKTFEDLDFAYKNKMQAYQKAQGNLIEKDTELSKKRKNLLNLSQKQSKTQVELSSLQSQKEEKERRKEGSLKILSELREKEKKQAQKFEELSQKYKEEKADQNQREQSLAEKKARFLKIEEEKQDQEQKLKALKESLTQKNERLESLKSLQAQFEGFQEGTRHLLVEQENAEEKIFLPLTDLLEVSKPYEKALESSLGSYFQLLFKEKTWDRLEFQERTLKNLEILKKNRKGRSSFFLGNFEAQKSHLNDLNFKEAVKKNQGEKVLQDKNSSFPSFPFFLSEVVQISEKISKEDKQFVFSLLSQIMLVSHLKEAFSLRDTHPHLNFVTLEGEFLSSSGLLTGGGEQGTNLNLLRRKNLIQELSLAREALDQKFLEAESNNQKLFEKKEDLKKEVEEFTESIHRQNILIAELTKDQERLESEKFNLNQAYQNQEKEQCYYENEIQNLSSRLSDTQVQLEEIKKKKETLEAEIQHLEKELKEKKEEVENIQNDVTQLQIESASKELEKKGLENEIKKLKAGLKELELKQKQTNKEWKENKKFILKEEKNLEEEKKGLELCLLGIKEKEKFLSEIKESFDGISFKLKTLEEELSNQFLENQKHKTHISESRFKLEEIKLKMKNLSDQAEENYSIKLENILSEYKDLPKSAEEMRQDIKRLKTQVSSLGEVYLLAIEEYKELKKSLDFFSGQYKELLQAKEELKKVIDHVGRICARRFKESFRDVNEKFSKVFPVLFGGGSAELVLLEEKSETDEYQKKEGGGEKELEDKKEAGIDIEVQPPGKKLKNIKLLSGGEKALTAAALIFSIFLLKPSPFCILDEVDAPLDDVNVSRFNSLVREMSGRSQMILVTHNKYTMEICDFLFGVTMEEKGISKILSTQLSSSQRKPSQSSLNKEEEKQVSLS